MFEQALRFEAKTGVFNLMTGGLRAHPCVTLSSAVYPQASSVLTPSSTRIDTQPVLRTFLRMKHENCLPRGLKARMAATTRNRT